MDADELAVELAATIADGGSVDWGEMEHQLGLHRMPIAPFRTLDAIARAHRHRRASVTLPFVHPRMLRDS